MWSVNEFLGFNGSDDGLGFADGGVGVVGRRRGVVALQRDMKLR